MREYEASAKINQVAIFSSIPAGWFFRGASASLVFFILAAGNSAYTPACAGRLTDSAGDFKKLGGFPDIAGDIVAESG